MENNTIINNNARINSVFGVLTTVELLLPYPIHGKVFPLPAILIALLGKDLSLEISFIKFSAKVLSQYTTYSISHLDALHLLM